MNTVYAERRRRLMEKVGEGMIILSTAPIAIRNADVHHPYRYDSYFYYLTGFTEPEAVLVLNASEQKSVLFCREKDPEQEVWVGFRLGPAGACEALGIDEAYAIDTLDSYMPDVLSGQPAVYWNVGRVPLFDQRVAAWLNALRSRYRAGVEAPEKFGDAAALIDEMRLIKDRNEIELLRHAGRISAQAHCAALNVTRPGMYEYQVEAEIMRTFLYHGARHCAYESIVASGGNACILHYTENTGRLNDGELLLIDAGCEWAGYAGDVTRTFPINGKFSTAQRDVYQIVLAAQVAAIEAIGPGVELTVPGDRALSILVQGMIDLNLLSGSVEGNIESGAYRQFYMHSIGHMIGLDVHDVGKRRVNGVWRTYQPGMCTTVEPGLYIRPAENVPESLYNIGIRIEDDVLVTETGYDVYTAAVPKSVDEIETLMRDKQ